MEEKKIYDLIIIGTGFAGYTAAIYASRYKMSNIIFGDLFGGQTVEAHEIGNYPGFESITGPELMNRVREQAKKLGTEEMIDRVVSIEDDASINGVVVGTKGGKQYYARYALVTVGLKHKHLEVPGEEELRGKGISYCATCDGFFFRDKTIAVIGGGDAATTSALFLSNIASQVYLIVRGDHLKGERIWADEVMIHPKVKVMFNTTVAAFEGRTKLTNAKINVTDIVSGKSDQSNLPIDGAFIEIGSETDTTFIGKLGLQTDHNSRVIVDKKQATNRMHVYAAGDVTNVTTGFNQLITAGAQAAVAVNSIFEKLQTEKRE